MESRNMVFRVGLCMLGLGLFSLIAPVAQSALIFHQDLEDATGLTASGTGQSFVPGVLGDALSLDGNGYYETDDIFPAMGSTNRTVSIWVNLSATAGTLSSIMQFGVDGGNTPGTEGEDWAMQVDSATAATSIELGKARGDGADGDITLTGSWQLITYTLDGTTMDETALYIDGNNIATYTIAPPGKGSNAVNTLATKIKFGSTITEIQHPNTISNWNGLLDDVSIWDTALTPNEIIALYAVGNRLAYDAKDFDRMLTVYNAGSGSVVVDSAQWSYASGLTGDAGLNVAGDTLILNAASGSGLVLIPEPATLSVLVIGGVVLLKRLKK